MKKLIASLSLAAIVVGTLIYARSGQGQDTLPAQMVQFSPSAAMLHGGHLEKGNPQGRPTRAREGDRQVPQIFDPFARALRIEDTHGHFVALLVKALYDHAEEGGTDLGGQGRRCKAESAPLGIDLKDEFPLPWAKVRFQVLSIPEISIRKLKYSSALPSGA